MPRREVVAVNDTFLHIEFTNGIKLGHWSSAIQSYIYIYIYITDSPNLVSLKYKLSYGVQFGPMPVCDFCNANSITKSYTGLSHAWGIIMFAAMLSPPLS